MIRTFLQFSILVFLATGCRESKITLFSLTDADDTGIRFSNDLPYTEEFNTYTYRNFYNGAGVALGDINNDGLTDIYLTGNINDNKLFLNKGDWKFEDITEKAGVACKDVWSTGATFVDINGDGWLDIYVCKAGKPEGNNRYNELFINKGNLTFEEKAAEYGLDITGLSIHSAFFDYDSDGDLDCYLLNNSLRSVGGYDLKEGQRNEYDPSGNKLLRNDNGRFVDVTVSSGIYASKIGYGLGITLSDFNSDGTTDIFISNDFFERDYLYFNQGDGTFKESAESAFLSLSMGSMGADACDLDNDLLPDLFVTEMLPLTLERKKTKTQYETWDKYQASVSSGYYHQFSRNVLQKNIGEGKFLEIGRFAGVEATEWSWASLAQDYDNDGLKDLFVSNGLYKDLLDKDYLNFSANENMIRNRIARKERVLTMLVDSMPSAPVKNCMFKNLGNMKFSMVSDEWGLSQQTFSNGSAYGDLDNDGDLDLVINNVNMPVFVYRNNTDTLQQRSIRFKLRGEGLNREAIGSKIIIKYKGGQAMSEHFPSRGFQSCMDPVVHFGVGGINLVDTAVITWPDGKQSMLTNLQTNKTHILEYGKMTKNHVPFKKSEFSNLCNASLDGFLHQDSEVNLFTRDRLATEMSGFLGPAVATGDINKDGKDDVFVGGGRNQTSVLYVSTAKGTLSGITTPFEADLRSEVTDAVFFDPDADGDLDLYVAHGGKTFSEYAPELHDVLYINDGSGSFTKKADALQFPYPIFSGSVVAADLNNDDLPEIIVSEYMKTHTYGLPGSVFVLHNKGNNVFETVLYDALTDAGMISSVAVMDVNKDGWKDLIFAGKWTPVTLVMNNKGSFNKAEIIKLTETRGMWNVLYITDVDGDGDEDILCGNEGENTYYKAGMRLYIHDFDANGTQEQILCQPLDGRYYPIHDIDEMTSQMPVLKKKYLHYRDLAREDIAGLFSGDIVSKSMTLDMEETRSMAFINVNGTFEKMSLPLALQYSSIHAFEIVTDKNQNRCLIAGGNNYRVKPQFGRLDGSLGWKVGISDKKGKIVFGNPEPLHIEGQIRDIKKLNDSFLVGINGSHIKICKIK
jgi:hypothetical protein